MNHPLPSKIFRSGMCKVLTCLIIFLIPIISFAQIPANNACAGSLSLIHGSAVCAGGTNVRTAQTLFNATNELNLASSCGGSSTSPDVYYFFVATNARAQVQASNLGGNWGANMRMQILSRTGVCAGLAEVACGTTTVTATTLTVGNTYYVRVLKTTNAAATGSVAAWAFDICLIAPPSNDLCSAPLPVTNGLTCTPAAGVLNAVTTYTADAVLDACNAGDNDVWYSFTANTTSVAVSFQGTPPANSRMQVVSNNCGGTFTSYYCGTGGTATGLTPGQVYLVRVYSTNNTTGAFNLCVVDQSANNACAGAFVLTSATTCVNTAGTMYASTNEGTIATAPCAGSIVTDVWYRFVAQTTNPTITLSNIGTAIGTPGIQLFSGSCGTPVSYNCGVTSGGTVTINTENLTVGSSYFIRVYQATGAAITTPTNAGFDICVTDPATPPPFNDECANAINVPVVNSCGSIAGSISGATLSSAPIGACAGPATYDVWYKFTAVTAGQTVTLGGGANNFTNRFMQIFQGSCGALSLVTCGASPLTVNTFVPGTTYYIRVYSTTAGAAPNGNANFTMCVTSPNMAPRYGNGYVNVSKRTSGGVVQPGDTLEIRMTINHLSGTLNTLRFVDNLPTNTRVDSSYNLRVVTNEGLIVKQYTINPGDDAGSFIATPPVNQFNIRMNLGFAGGANPATVVNNTSTEIVSATGQMANTNNPRGGGGLLFAISYRVIVTGTVGDTIELFPSRFIFRRPSTSTDTALVAAPYRILISDPMSLCANATGVNMSQEFGGTFGSGTPLNRTTDLLFPIPGYSYMHNVSNLSGLGDGRYSIVKNISPYSSTIRTADRTPTCPTALPSQLACANRMHGGHWDIDGDHTGTNNAIGNVPPSHTTSSGYMLMVNADYIASETFRQTIPNLCPNTYYEFSAWLRNICPTCGVDSLGANYLPRQAGVLPNLTFEMDGVDRYSTGAMDIGGWYKKGFVFRTDTNQTSMTFVIRNNAQGGGGNDWVMDDISIATCLPNMQYSPSLNPTVCWGNAFVLYDTIRSYFNNYRHHQWQRSTDGGVTWTDVGIARDSTPVFNATLNAWEYVTSITIPPSNTQMTDSANLYRVLVATTANNLSNANCRVTDGISFITLSVENCGIPLKTDLLSFSGKLVANHANLTWTTSKEEEPVVFEVQRSMNGTNFTTIATVNGNNNGSSLNNYSLTDPDAISGKWYYRIAMISTGNKMKMSRTIMLSKTGATNFALANVINPFHDQLEFSITSPSNGKIDVKLTDMSGNIVRKNSYILADGVNSLVLPNTGNLPAGFYIMQVVHDNEIITKKVFKKN